MSKEYDECLFLSYPLAWEKMDEYSKRIHRKNYEKIKQSMKDVGINFKIENGEMQIFLYRDSYEKKRSRNAGAKKKRLLEQITLEEVRDRMAMGETVEQIAKSLGISRATLFRRLKECDQEHRDVIS